MAASMSVFLQSDLDLPSMAAEVERILSISLTRVEEDGLVRYEHSGVGYRMTLRRDHGLEDDMGMAFSRFPHEIDFAVSPVGADPEHAENLKYWLAMYAFGKLATGLRCPAMVVHDLQRLIDARL
jgi:hypothetical protein